MTENVPLPQGVFCVGAEHPTQERECVEKAQKFTQESADRKLSRHPQATLRTDSITKCCRNGPFGRRARFTSDNCRAITARLTINQRASLQGHSLSGNP
ncbi:hypothetical protein, partial [Streptomyces misionensis]|uniref:hypothetical protein n=1 Tax=Streptomyces misionensis TaxID=67331 RepID=UPI0036898CB4